MEPDQAVIESVNLVDSMTAVEFDAETETFQAEFDSTHDSTTQAVIALVAAARGSDPLDLSPLYYAVDTDMLEKLFSEVTTGIQLNDSISFSYEGFEITIFSEGLIEADPKAHP